MNVNVYVVVSALTVGVLSVLLNWTGRQKYKDDAKYYESFNADLRSEVDSLKSQKTALTEELAAEKAASAQKDETIKQLKPFSAVVETMNNNHKEILDTIANFAEGLHKAYEKREANRGR